VSDTDNATASNRIRIYVNGAQLTLSGNTVTSGTQWTINTTNQHRIGNFSGNLLNFSGYLADIHFIDGQALDPTSFGEFSATTGVWVPKAYTGSYGTNGFRLDFSDNSAATATTLGKDRAGSNNWTPNNFSITAGAGNDSLVDVPTSYGTDTGVGGEVRGNYAVLNPLSKSSNNTFSNGSLEATWNNSAANQAAGAISTIQVTSGKWYWEFTTTLLDQGYPYLGFFTNHNPSASAGAPWVPTLVSGASWQPDGTISTLGCTKVANAGTYLANDILGFALDRDAGTLRVYKNGVAQNSGNAVVTDITGLIGPGFGQASSTITANFGQRPFAYAAPSGFKALCTANLPAPVVTKPSTVMDVLTITGANQAYTGLNFSPDFLWFKRRDNIEYHYLFDTIRGGAGLLYSNRTDAEVTGTTYISAFGSNGFTTANGLLVNSASYVTWAWDAGSSTVTNTAGSISSQVRANASAGFSIVTYTSNGTNGSTIGHGLGIAPQFVIVKNRLNATNWMVGHQSLDATTPWNYYLRLNGTIARAAAVDFWNNTAPTSSVLTLGTSTSVNSIDGDPYVAYCFAPVAGYSSAFSFTGNGSTDGPMCYLGFRPRLILLKRTDSTSYWHMYDTARNTYNVADANLWANGSDAEISNSAYNFDLLSNGFKVRTSDAARNASGGTYVGFAWAESPFQYARAR